MKIYIPTRGRVVQKTWDRMPKSLRSRTYLVCPPEEYKDHKSLGRNAIACPITGISAVRQWLVERETDKFAMSDDDHFFFRRISISRPALRKVNDTDMEEMFARMEQLLDRYPMVGVSGRQTNDVFLGRRYASGYRKRYEIEPGLIYNNRICNLYGVRADILKEKNIRFDTVKIMEDMNVSLSLIAQGYDTALMTEWCWNQPRSGSVGGCSLYRDAAMQKQAAVRLAAIHRPFVLVIRRTGKAKKENTAWRSVSDDTQTRYDVRVDWQAAVAAGKQVGIERLV